jgi:hypothetical protein
MARLFGQIAVGGRSILSMECALVCLLLGLSIVGYATGLDRTTRGAASGLVAGLYEPEEGPAVRGVPIPKSAAAHVAPVQAQAGRGQ